MRIRCKPFFPAALGGMLMVSVLLAGPARAGQNEDELRSAAQNPLADLISLPFQNNTDFGIGEHDRVKNTLNIQPVYPVSLGSWVMINRAILPVVYQPDVAEEDGGEWGLGDTSWTAWFAPPAKDSVTWGVGPVALIPTSTKDETGAGEWGLGPSFVLLWQPPGWTVGGLISNVWSIGEADTDINLMTFQPFVNYNLPDSWYLITAPIVTANWEAPSGDEWTVPLGGGFGKIYRIGRQPVNSQLSAYYNVEKPTGGADWQLRVQVQFLFPK